jgi:hypothetical protein
MIATNMQGKELFCRRDTMEIAFVILLWDGSVSTEW